MTSPFWRQEFECRKSSAVNFALVCVFLFDFLREQLSVFTEWPANLVPNCGIYFVKTNQIRDHSTQYGTYYGLSTLAGSSTSLSLSTIGD